MGPALCCMSIVQVMEGTREALDPRGVDAFAFLDISSEMRQVAPDTVEVLPFFQQKTSNVSIAINPKKKALLPPKGNVRTLEEIAP